ncbi:MAG TPA: PD-(D/E)XK nuclease family protein, partial [Thermoanaerobaculia bacterium]|nr:PD-(D/E)XK nuclease family protein [Thermoanaerobaculia bacterium]
GGDLDPDREAVPVAWPDGEGFERLLAGNAHRVVEEEGISLPGLARALAARARPFLEVARMSDWGEPGTVVSVLGAEVLGAIDIPLPAGGSRPVRFKADRIDHLDGELRLTDYKTGRPLSTAKTEKKRAEHFLKGVRTGTRLQAVAYRLAASQAGWPALGRYLYLKPELETREFSASAGAPELEQAFQQATAEIFAAWEAGTFFPRVVDLSGRAEPGRCGFCSVAEACLRGDSGARGRLFEWANAAPSAAATSAPFLAVWRLPSGGDIVDIADTAAGSEKGQGEAREAAEPGRPEASA